MEKINLQHPADYDAVQNICTLAGSRYFGKIFSLFVTEKYTCGHSGLQLLTVTCAATIFSMRKENSENGCHPTCCVCSTKAV